MAHRKAYEGSPQRRPVDVVSCAGIERVDNKPMISSAPIAGHDNGAHQAFWVDTVRYYFRNVESMRCSVVTDVIYPEHGRGRGGRLLNDVSQNA
jgi:hypothetical protein